MATLREVRQFLKLIGEFADPYEGNLYHYTSAEGLRGIVENNEIWMTNVNFVNDTTECRALEKETELFSNSDFTTKEVKDEWFQFLKVSRDLNNTYIVSFSSGEESLSQWRAYGDYRIGFDAKRLAKAPFNLYRCVYSKEEIRNWILEKDRLTLWKEFTNKREKRGLAYYLIYTASRKYKDEHFKDEKEFRLLVLSDYKLGYHASNSMYDNQPPIHFRDHPKYNMPFPYVKFTIQQVGEPETGQKKEKKETHRQSKERRLAEERKGRRNLLPIKDILIGPMSDQEKAKTACEILLYANGYNKVSVDTSKIPYRGS